jgi:hypothetical protein
MLNPLLRPRAYRVRSPSAGAGLDRDADARLGDGCGLKIIFYFFVPVIEILHDALQTKMKKSN